MDKEIKFRLRINNKIVGYEKWYSGHNTETDPCSANPCWLYSKDGRYWNPKYIYHKQKDQFTGLKDKNGKEIYKSDYVFIEDFYIGDKIQIGGKCEVKWNEDGFSLFIEDEYICGLWDAVNNYSGEIIGNIYENPELLKAGE